MGTKAILWDFDGTLAYRDGLWGGCLTEVLGEREPRSGITRDQIRPLLREGFPWHRPDVAHPELDAEAWWASVELVLRDACVALGIPEHRARAHARETRIRYVDPTGFRLFDDVVPVLTSLRSAGWRHVILSNHVPELESIAHGLQLAGLVDEILSSAVTGYEKPHGMAYELGRAAAGDPSTLWMVGDNGEADVRGAEAAGIPGILVRTTDPAVERSAADLYGVQAFLR